MVVEEVAEAPALMTEQRLNSPRVEARAHGTANVLNLSHRGASENSEE
jgi:hypothetical protein